MPPTARISSVQGSGTLRLRSGRTQATMNDAHLHAQRPRRSLARSHKSKGEVISPARTRGGATQLGRRIHGARQQSPRDQADINPIRINLDPCEADGEPAQRNVCKLAVHGASPKGAPRVDHAPMEGAVQYHRPTTATRTVTSGQVGAWPLCHAPGGLRSTAGSWFLPQQRSGHRPWSSLTVDRWSRRTER